MSFHRISDKLTHMKSFAVGTLPPKCVRLLLLPSAQASWSKQRSLMEERRGIDPKTGVCLPLSNYHSRNPHEFWNESKITSYTNRWWKMAANSRSNALPPDIPPSLLMAQSRSATRSAHDSTFTPYSIGLDRLLLPCSTFIQTRPPLFLGGLRTL